MEGLKVAPFIPFTPFESPSSVLNYQLQLLVSDWPFHDISPLKLKVVHFSTKIPILNNFSPPLSSPTPDD